MALRSDADWHLDPFNVHTIDRFFAETGRTRQGETPFSEDIPGTWTGFSSSRRSAPHRGARRSARAAHGAGRTSRATARHGRDHRRAARRRCRRVLVFPPPVPGSWRRCCRPGAGVTRARPSTWRSFAGRRVTIVGGRQSSAFEWAALLCRGRRQRTWTSSTWARQPAIRRVGVGVDSAARRAHRAGPPSWFRRLSESEQKACCRTSCGPRAASSSSRGSSRVARRAGVTLA